MTLAHGADRLESARLVLRRITADHLPFFTRIHALPEVAQHLYPGGRPRSRQETAAFLQSIFESYEQLALGYLAVLRKEDGALIGRCGLMELVVEAAVPEHGLRKGWFGVNGSPPSISTPRSRRLRPPRRRSQVFHSMQRCRPPTTARLAKMQRTPC